MRIIFLLLVLLFPLKSFSSDNYPLARDGVLDLRNIPDPDHFIVTLNGSWEFYWNQMLHPHDFDTVRRVPDYYGAVPSYWTDYPSSVLISKTGYATYRLRVLLPKDRKVPLAFDLPVFDSAFDIYINGKYYDGNGTTGTSVEEESPEYRRAFFRFNPDSDVLTIIINVSNFHHRRGGFWLPVKMGTFNEVQKKLANTWAADWAVVSFLMGFSLFFFFFFLFSPGEKIMGFFSMVTSGLAFRPFFTNHFLILNIFDISWEWMVKWEYFGLYFIIIGIAWFAWNLYPTLAGKIIAWSVTVLFTCTFALTLFLPVKLFSYFILIFYPCLMILIGYLLVRSFIGALNRNRIDIIYFAAFMLLLAGGLNDIIVSLGKSNSGSGYLLTYIIVLFVFMHATLLLYKWINTFREKELLRKKMEFMNRNLELLVSERTAELQRRSEEIEITNNQIAEQNRQLSETIQLKNRIFSVISHDLRSPVVNILYMLNLLKEKEFKEKYDTFANTSIQYAQGVISLLENMLVWGRGQEDKIKVSPANHDVSDIILTNLSIFKETADKKEISVNFTQVGSPVAFCDRDLLDIVIRNLLSNAVKYTRRKGRISIFLKDKKSTGEGLMLKVCDNGTGISPEKMDTIFASEEIESTPGTENEKGTGLGLKLCNELIKLNNGTITAESKINEGTCFVIMLPA